MSSSSFKPRWLIALAIGISAALSFAFAPPSIPPSWRAWVDCPGGELPFGIEFDVDEKGVRAWIVNGVERIDVPSVEWDGETLTLGIDYYDSRIEAKIVGDGRLEGTWKKKGRGDKWTTMKFHATAGKSRRFLRDKGDGTKGDSKSKANAQSVTGRWSVRFAKSDDAAVAIFNADDSDSVSGTFMTTTGDYRYLAGTLDGTHLRLSTFDGAHAFLFDADIQSDGTIEGDFWSRDSWHETWTAKRDPAAALPDAFALSRAEKVIPLSELKFPDVDGKLWSLDDAKFAGKARIIEVFGSWCPNCHDATNYMVELDKRYRTRGLRILGLAFELSGDFKRDARQVKRYIASHGIEYPILIAGTSDKSKATDALGFLDRLRAYPTTLFVDAKGSVRAVYTGFSGPATGDAHRDLRTKFEKHIEALLDEGDHPRP